MVRIFSENGRNKMAKKTDTIHTTGETEKRMNDLRNVDVETSMRNRQLGKEEIHDRKGIGERCQKHPVL